MRHHGAGRPVGVLPLLHEVVDEGLSHAPGGPNCFWGGGGKGKQDVSGVVWRYARDGTCKHAPEGSYDDAWSNKALLPS